MVIDKADSSSNCRRLNKFTSDTTREDMFVAYFSIFQLNMQRRKRIPKEIVVNYKNEITFMLTTDKCYMEAVMPRKIWIPSFGYEVTKEMIEGTTQFCYRVR